MLEEEIKKRLTDLDLSKIITAFISVLFCTFLIIVYFISCLQIKCSICAKKENATPENTRKSYLEKSLVQFSNEKKSSKIGLGSNFIFFLILSNLLSGLGELGAIYYNYYISFFEDNKHGPACQFFGFIHNLFDLSSVCWTSMLGFLFYGSTKLTSEILYKYTKYLLIGISYNLLSGIIFCVIPYLDGCYGYAKTYCFFYEGDNRIAIMIWKIAFIIFVLINTIFNIYCFYKTTRFYSKKLTILKSQNYKEYIFVLIYSRVFQLFAITLIISRSIKFISLIIIPFAVGLFKEIMIYLNADVFNLTGAFNAFASIFLFRGVFWCCISSRNNNQNEENNEIKKDINQIEGEEIEDNE